MVKCSMLKFLILLTFLSSLVFAQTQTKPGSQDHYKSFAELAAKNLEGEDYEIEFINRDSKILVMAFHGGYIESGSTQLASAITSEKFNYYTFKGLRVGELDESSFTSSTLHLTSTHFDEPQLMELTSKADFCLGLHGFGGQEADFCVGGGNADERKELVKALTDAYPDYKSCELCCSPFNGTAKKNPVNRCKLQGIQVEMSPRVRKSILKDQVFLKSLSDVFKGYLDTL